MTGKLNGIPYCSEDALAAAAAASGVSEQASPACPASEIGTASTDTGTGPNPLKIGGKAYLAGPYKGAPLSMVVVTPVSPGPFDLGNVVVRVALFVDPKTAQVKAVSDPIPDVFGGVKLDLRTIDVNVDRSKFMKNPTNCRAGAVSGVLNGGGANPTDPAAFSSYPVSAPYQATNCKGLGFKPKMYTRLFGGKGMTQRAKHPKLRAILEARESDANVLRSALALPRRCSSTRATSGRFARGRSWPRAPARRRPSTATLRPSARCSASRCAARSTWSPPATRTAGPGRRSARPGERPAARRDQLRERRDQDRVQQDRRTCRSPSSSSAWKAAPKRDSWSTPGISARARWTR